MPALPGMLAHPIPFPVKEPAMHPRPRISLCIPTCNRSRFLAQALQSAIREASAHPAGTVEVLVSDNASTDDTPELLARFRTAWPELRTFRNEANLGFDLNYLKCVEEARGEFVWVLGDDDVFLPQSVSKVLSEIEGGADVCLCLAEACDNDLNPLITLPWFLDADPPRVWRLEGREDRIAYFNACARNAGVFAFISVTIFRRDRFLSNRPSIQTAVRSGYVHLWGMMEFIRQPTRLHYIPEALVRNRMSDLHADSLAATDLYARLMNDLRVWCWVADLLLEDEELKDAFVRVVGRNHHSTILPGLRRNAGSEAEWQEAVPFLQRAGFSPLRIAATGLGFQYLQGQRQPPPALASGSLCLADLPLVARGARLTAVLALGGLQDLLAGAGLLAALRAQKGGDQVLVFCRPETADLLAGFQVIPVETQRYLSDESYRESLVAPLKDKPIDLLVNLNPQRGIEGDDLCAILHPPGAVAFHLPEQDQSQDLVQALNEAYTCLLPVADGMEGFRKTLGLPPSEPVLWPGKVALEQVQGFMAQFGWESATTMAILLDHPSIAEDPAFLVAFAQAQAAGWNFVGIGGRASQPLLAGLCDALDGRAINLAGMLNLAAMAALLQQCGAFIGGTQLLRDMAKACECVPFEA
ncbi:MAG: glycosyltransferase [Holophagaceae bacterium]|nr:glycosyltransferase [Holophagaceae bacterium]